MSKYEVVSEMKVRLHVAEPKSYTEKNVLGDLYEFCYPQIVSNAVATKMRIRDKEHAHYELVFDLTSFNTDKDGFLSNEKMSYFMKNYRKLTSVQVHQMFDGLHCGKIIDGKVKKLKFFITKGEISHEQ